MENLLYNILWIDDEHETLNGLKGRAKSHGIKLVGYKSLNGGMGELERNYPFYDGVILDAQIFENEDDVEGTEDTENVHRAKERLLQLKKKFKIFVFTGQAETYKDQTFNKAFKNVYKKGSSRERDRLFTDIKEAAAGQQDTQLRHAYKPVFDVCTEKYIGEYAGQDVLTLLKIENDITGENHFNIIRKIMEDIFSAFHKFNLLPSEFVTPNIALNPSSKFLEGGTRDETEWINYNDKKFRHLSNETRLPKHIANHLRCILNVTQTGSHRSDIDRYVRTVNTPYLLKSVLYQLFDTLVWFKIYVESNPKRENWEVTHLVRQNYKSQKGVLVSGSVIEFNLRKGFAFFKPDDQGDNVYIPVHLVSDYSLQNDMQIRAEVESYADNRTGEQKLRVKKVELV